MRWQQVEADLRAQVAALQAAVEEKDKDMHTVMATVDRLQAMPNGLRPAGTVSVHHSAPSVFPPQCGAVVCFTLFCIQWCASLCFVSKKCFIILHAFDNSELIVMQDIYSHMPVTESTEQ